MDESLKDIFDAFQGKVKEYTKEEKKKKILIIKSSKDLYLLNELPEDLDELIIQPITLKELPSLPKNLKTLRCEINALTKLPELPKFLEQLHCNGNELIELPELPDTLISLLCNSNKLKRLPKLPKNLYELECNLNQLEELPKLPNGLGYLRCYSNKLKELPKLPENLNQLICRQNELESLPDLHNTHYVDASKNKISKFPNYINVYSLLLNDNLLTKIPKNIKINRLSLYNNPVAEKMYHVGQPDTNLIQYREYNGEKFPVITFRKGTVLFRNYHDLSLVAEDFIGKVKKSFLWGEEYYLSPDHLIWYSLSPFDTMFGNIKSINVLQQDVTLILGLLPSEYIGRDIILFGETKFQIDCIDKKYKRKVEQGNDYGCFRDDFIEQNPDIMGSFQNFPSDDRKAFNSKNNFELDYETFYEDHSKYVNVPEVVLYPRKIRDTKDRILNKKKFNQEWFEKHIDEYNVKPLHVFEGNYNDLTKYKTIIDQFLSPEGFSIDGNTYHMTVNKKTRDFVISEFASPELLELCLPISDKDKQKFLKK
jgi:hypothetical protein